MRYQVIVTAFPFFEEERRLDVDEKPLVVQLNWNKDDREGRFVLKNENDTLAPKVSESLYIMLVLTTLLKSLGLACIGEHNFHFSNS